MNGFVLRLVEDRLGPDAHSRPELPPLNRVLYVLEGALAVTSGDGTARVAENSAWHGAGACTMAAGADGATVLRYELLRPAARTAGVTAATSKLLLEQPITLEPTEQHLMRCDRVDFAPGGVALPHRHRGGGIRCLIAGSIELRIGDEPARVIHPGQAWFESGREPVLATGDRESPTSFIRCSILPRAIRGQSSIIYVDPADAARGRPRQYTVFVDEPIDLG